MDADRTALTGLPFRKLVGSGNDFVFLDGRDPALRALESPDVVRRICARRTGVGADGVVWLLPEGEAGLAFRMRYYNADGSLADMCGNAALCSVALATELGMASASDPFRFRTDAGILTGRRRGDGQPEVAMPPLRGLSADASTRIEAQERRHGLATTGVPHLVVLVDDAASVDVAERGRRLRSDATLGPAGANVNFVSAVGDGQFRMRTFERGVEGETLACGTGSVATAALIRAWGLAGDRVSIRTSSGLIHEVTLPASSEASPTLSGEGRVVFEGRFGTL